MKRSIMLAAGLAFGVSAGTAAQDSARTAVSRWLLPGSDAENYLRYLQTLRSAPPSQWSIRPFSVVERRELRSTLRGSAPTIADRPSRSGRRLQISVAPLEAAAWYNTSLPYGFNDGAVWVGRGLTISTRGGFALDWGPLELTVRPIAFWADNRPFEPAPDSGASEFTDPQFPVWVDRPPRFGARSYARIDPGQSTLRLDFGGVTMGFSTANQWWGPMSEYPYLVGTNAAGFEHVFLGSAKPVNVWLGRLHARVIYGRLHQSAFSPAPADSAIRFASGLVAAFQPAMVPGLEIGAARFFHEPWPDSGLTEGYFTHVLQTFLKRRIGKRFLDDRLGGDLSNQLASLHARWTLAQSGFEVYGEFGREDHNADGRDLLLEPDHSSAYGVGLRKAWRQGEGVNGVRLELANLQPSTLERHRPINGTYVHGMVRQGHTQRGQLLGTPIAGKGAAASAMFERFRADGIMRASWSRLVVRDSAVSRGTDVEHVWSLEKMFLRARRRLLRVGVDAVREYDRDFTHDVFNARFRLGYEWSW